MKLKAQLHIHTKSDPVDLIFNSEKEIIDEAAKLEYEVLAFTCHNHYFENKKLFEYAKKKNILLIFGIEKTISGAHIGILHADKKAEKIKNFDDLKKYKKSHPNSLVIANHIYYPRYPGYRKWKEVIKHIKLIDALEYSWYYLKWYNPYNIKMNFLAKKYNIPVITTSDNHVLRFFDYSYSLIDAEKNWKSIKKAIIGNKIKIVSKPLSLAEITLDRIYGFFVISIGSAIRNTVKKII